MQIDELNALVESADSRGTRVFPKRLLRAQTLCETVSCIPADIEPSDLEYILDCLQDLGWQ
jgi:hypothetical protein